MVADLIDREALLNKQHTQYDWNDVVYVEDIQNAPTVDAVPVVRCKDCKNAEPVYNLIGLAIDNLVYCKYSRCTEEFDWYCADGERK